MTDDGLLKLMDSFSEEGTGTSWYIEYIIKLYEGLSEISINNAAC